MADLELTRRPGDRRLYSLEGVGTLRLEGMASRKATAEADGQRWRLARRGVWRQSIDATDSHGATVGEFSAPGMRRGGALRWGERDFALQPAGKLRERYALVHGDDELALFDGKGWGRRPVKVTIDQPSSMDAGLLLFASFVVRGLAEDAGAAAASASTSGA